LAKKKHSVNHINAFLVFYIVHTTQMGIGIIGVPRILYTETKQDSWFVVLITGMIISILVYVITKTSRYFQNKDLFDIHLQLAGPIGGRLLNVILICYFIGGYYAVMMGYIEISATWGYEGLYEWVLALALILVSIYAVLGGIRIIAGICFITFFITVWIICSMIPALDHIILDRMKPIFQASMPELARGVYRSSFTMIGFEVLYFIYPYIKEKQKIFMYSLLANGFTTFFVCAFTLLAILYFSGAQLERTIWAVLNIISIVKLPFIERFEYVFSSLWMLVILTNLSIFLWIASKGIKKVFQFKQKYSVWIIGVIVFVMSLFLNDRTEHNQFIDYVGMCGFYLWFCYPIILLFWSWIHVKRTRRGEDST
jgi:spore germination protein AB